MSKLLKLQNANKKDSVSQTRHIQQNRCNKRKDGNRLKECDKQQINKIKRRQKQIYQWPMKIIYINLSHEKTRRDYILREFKRIHIPSHQYEQYSSLWGRNISTQLLRALQENGKLVKNVLGWQRAYQRMDRNKLAIYLSHIFLWQKIHEYVKNEVYYDQSSGSESDSEVVVDTQMLKNDEISLRKGYSREYNLIIEDDVIFPVYNSEYTLQMMIEENVKRVPDDWDIIFIGRSKYLNGVKVADNVLRASPGHRKLTNHGMFAYLIRTKSIPKLLDLMLPIPIKYMHIDWKLRTFYNRMVNAYYLINPIIVHNNQIPSIRESR